VRNQDYELNIRLRESGNLVWFDPNLVVRYRPRSSIKALFLQYFQYGRWKRSVLKLHPTSLRIRQLMPPLLIIGILFGIVVSVFFSLLGLLIPCIYLGTIAIASLIQKPRRATDKLFLMLIFPTMHIAWGLGFLFGK